MELFENAVQKLIKRGYTRESAQILITKRFQNSGIFLKGTQQPTEHGIKQQSKTKVQRRMERYAKKMGVPVRMVRMKQGNPVLMSIYKK